jgi:hypothetical protein
MAAVCATLLTAPTDMLRTHAQLGLSGAATSLRLRDTWRAVVGSSMGHRALFVGATPRVSCLRPHCTCAGRSFVLRNRASQEKF